MKKPVVAFVRNRRDSTVNSYLERQRQKETTITTTTEERISYDAT